MAAIDLAPWGGAAVAGMWRMAGEQFGGGSASFAGEGWRWQLTRAREGERQRGEKACFALLGGERSTSAGI